MSSPAELRPSIVSRSASVRRRVQSFSVRRQGSERKVLEKYSALVTLDDIRANDYNLNIPRYVDTFEEEAEIDLAAVRAERLKLDAELDELEKKMAAYLKELGYGE